jgi:hypothetical protein
MQQLLHVSAGLLDSVEEMETGLAQDLLMVVAKKSGKAEQRDKGRSQIMRHASHVGFELFVLLLESRTGRVTIHDADDQFVSN